MNYKQRHPETCLAKCLMILLEKITSKRIAPNYELNLLIYSLKHSRENIARGHLEKVIKDYNVKIKWYVDSKVFFNFIRKWKLPKNLSINKENISSDLIDKIDKPIILYLDRFYLWKKKDGLYYKYHYPHFIIVTKKIKSSYQIIDPDDGRVKNVNNNALSKAVISLRNHLWISPHIIKIK